jgi:PTH1 family peptidyl-tRNA hydrolase
LRSGAWIVLGLGNPGEEYRSTRHNLGFRVLDRLAREHGLAFRVDAAVDKKAWTVAWPCREGLVVLAKPRTYMNRSGAAAVALCRRHDCAPERLLAVYDDADLELGRVRVRPDGGAGGHNGIRSLIDALGTREFPRLRLGVRGATRSDADLADYVLERFDPQEEPLAESLVELGAEAAAAIVLDGVEAAMNRYSGRHAGTAG